MERNTVERAIKLERHAKSRIKRSGQAWLVVLPIEGLSTGQQGHSSPQAPPPGSQSAEIPQVFIHSAVVCSSSTKIDLMTRRNIFYPF